MKEKRLKGTNMAVPTPVNRSALARQTFALFICLFISADDVETTLPVATRATSVTVREHRDLQSLETRVKAAAQKAISCTVSVRVGRGSRGGYAFGSGVIISDDGYVLTAAHVSSRPNRRVVFRLADGRTAEGVTLGLQKDLDMGLMKIDDSDETWPFLRRARSSRVEAGDWVIATGHPGGFDEEARALVRLGRVLKTTDKVLLTDCTLVGGDSGGPLVDINGNVVGIHSRIGADLTTNLHVPIDRYAENWDRLAKRDVWGMLVSVSPWIGIEHDPTYEEAKIKRIRGGGPAERAGLLAGDTVVRFGGERVTSFAQLKQLVSRQNPGTRLSVQYRREGRLIESMLKVGQQQSPSNTQTRDDAELLKDWLQQIDLRRRHGRAIVGIGKNADQVKESFHDVLETASRATVEVLASGTSVALGTIVDQDLILTKATQLRGKDLRCKYRNSRAFSVELIGELRSHDLALLRSSKPLPSIELEASHDLVPGSLLASSGLNVWPLAIGVVSAASTEIRSEGKLGIRMRGADPRITDIMPGTGADVAGLRVNDLIMAIDNIETTTAQDLIDIVSQRYPGDLLRITLNRNGNRLEVPVELTRYSQFDAALAEFEDFIGGKLSERRTGFSLVLQHDSAIRPVHCGGPVVDINGRFVGINIARAARTTSYLLPAEQVKLAVAQLKELRTDVLHTVDVRAANK